MHIGLLEACAEGPPSVEAGGLAGTIPYRWGRIQQLEAWKSVAAHGRTCGSGKSPDHTVVSTQLPSPAKLKEGIKNLFQLKISVRGGSEKDQSPVPLCAPGWAGGGRRSALPLFSAGITSRAALVLTTSLFCSHLVICSC